MASAKLPWMKLYTGDVLGDPSLRSCCLAARGLFLDMLSMMHRSVRRGYLCQDNGQPWTMDQLARLTGCSTEEAAHLSQELITSGVFSVTDDGIIYSRRMVKEAGISDVRRDAGERGARAKHLPQQNSGKGGGKPSGKQGGKPLNSNSLFSGSILPDEIPEEKKEEVLPQQNSGKNEDPADAALNAAALRCTVAWCAVLVGRKDDPVTCAKSFRGMLEDGIPEDRILAEIALGPKTEPKRKRHETINDFWKRLAGQNGFTSKVAGISQRSLTAGGPAPAEASSMEAGASPTATVGSAFAAFKCEMVNRTPSMPRDHSFIDPWERIFGCMNPPATGEEMLYGLECWLMDERRVSDKWFGVAKNAMPHIRRAINKNRQISEREHYRIADIIARTVPKTPKSKPSDIGARAPVEALETAPPPWVAFGEMRDFARVICEAMGAPRFSLWFVGKTSMNLVDDVLHIGTANNSLLDWFKKKFTADITAALATLPGRSRGFKVVVDPAIVLGAVEDEDCDQQTKVG